MKITCPEHIGLSTKEYAMLRGTDAKTAKKTFLNIALKESMITIREFEKGKVGRISAEIIKRHIPGFDTSFEGIKTVLKSQERTADIMYCAYCNTMRRFCTKHRLYGLLLDEDSKEILTKYWKK